MNNPTQLSTVGLDPTTTKTLLQTFSVIFFGLITFLGIGLLVANLYRLITVKNKPKLGYALGSLFWFLIFIFAIVLWANVITKIRNFSVDSILDSNSLILPFLQLKDGVKNVHNTPDLKLIAPATMYYEINAAYSSRLLWSLWQVAAQAVTLDCGNGQNLTLNLTTNQFDGSCIYFKKGQYDLTVDIKYINIPTSERLEKTYSGWSVIFDSQIDVSPTKTSLTFNDANTEMIVGKAPSKVMFDASAIFRDLALTDYKIVRDFDGDGTPDKQDNTATTFVYNQAKLYNVYVRFPGLNNYIYTFPIRVEQSDVPVCEVILTQTQWKNYDITTNFFDKTVKILSYQFDVLDRNNNDKIIDTIRNNNGAFTYQFLTAGNYAIQSTFLTENDKQGQCESDDVQIGASDFQVKYDSYYKSPQSPQFKKMLDVGSVSLVSGAIIVTELPSVIKIQLIQISPNISTASKKILLDGKQILSTDKSTFEFTIDDNQSHEATIVIEDVPSGAKTEISIPITVNRADIIGKLVVSPDTVGTDPFTVKFDASTTIVNDTGDELVSFTWDFWDGTGSIKKDFSQSIISHTYRYDSVNNNGKYHPILTIKTKKGREITISPANDIIVKRATQKLNITIPDYPAQIANVGDRVWFSIEFNGLPSEIRREFGDGKTLTCTTRQECGTTTHVYAQAGTYLIRAAIAYTDQPTIDGTITLKIK